MNHEAIGRTGQGKLGFRDSDLIDMFRRMQLIRRFEERVEDLFLVKKVVRGLSHLSIGQEGIAVGLASALKPDDLLVSNYRGHGHSIAKGVPPRYVMAEIFGKKTGTCGGVGGSMHSAKYPEAGLMYATAIVGSGIPIAAGMAFAMQRQKTDKVVAVCFGEGAVNIGAFHEAVNIAALWKLPLILVCEDNQYAMSMKIENSTAGPGIISRAEAYGIPGVKVDGNDVLAVNLAVKDAASRARSGDGPTLLLCRTYRIKGHGIYDVASYRPSDEVEKWKVADPIESLRKRIISNGIVSNTQLEEIDADCIRGIDEAVQFAQDSPSATLEELGRLARS